MLLTIQQTARELAVSTKTVRRIIDSGQLRVVKITDSAKGQRIHPDDLDNYIKGNRCQSGKQKQENTLSKSETAQVVSGLDALLAPKKKQSRSKRNSGRASKTFPPLQLVSKKH